jgi:hypothetical protein
LTAILFVLMLQAPPPPCHGSIHLALAAMAAGQAADTWTTRQALRRSGTHEGNWLYGSKPSTARLVATKAAIFVPIAIVLDKAFPKHPKATVFVASLLGALGSAAAVHNTRQGR